MNQQYPNLTAEQVALSDFATKEAKHQTNNAPKAPGECAGFQRVVTTDVLGIDRSWHPGPDAIQVGDLLDARGCALPDGTQPEVGDLLVWSEGHGPHGHIAMRVLGNRVAENSSAHVDANGDARGFRPLATLDPNFKVYRLWR